MNPFEKSNSVEKNIYTLENRLSELQESISTVSLEKSLDSLLKVLSAKPIDKENLFLIQSRVALIFDRLLESWQKDGKSFSDFNKKITSFFASSKKLPDVFTHSRPDQLGKRQPSLFESILETLKRFEALERFELVFEKSCKGMIVGGSLSYGPYFNVRAQRNLIAGSDIDTILVIDENENARNWDRFIQSPDFSHQEKQEFIDRKDIFLKTLLPRDKADILSQKFHMKGTRFEISAHFFTHAAMNRLLLNNTNIAIINVDNIFTLKDYRSERFPYKTCLQKNFEGIPYIYDVPEQRTVEKGVISELPEYIINDHKLHPGVYQNLVLPSFFIFHDRDGELTENVSSFKKKIIGHIARNYPEKNIQAAMLESHVRSDVFSETLRSTEID